MTHTRESIEMAQKIVEDVYETIISAAERLEMTVLSFNILMIDRAEKSGFPSEITSLCGLPVVHREVTNEIIAERAMRTDQP